MELDGYSLTLFRMLSHYKNYVNIDPLKNDFFGISVGENINKITKALINRGMIKMDIEENALKTKFGKDFLKTYDSYEEKKIKEGYFRFAILKFLYEIEGKIYIDAFPKILK
jgi:hypothetical protein